MRRWSLAAGPTSLARAGQPHPGVGSGRARKPGATPVGSLRVAEGRSLSTAFADAADEMPLGHTGLHTPVRERSQRGRLWSQLGGPDSRGDERCSDHKPKGNLGSSARQPRSVPTEKLPFSFPGGGTGRRCNPAPRRGTVTSGQHQGHLCSRLQSERNVRMFISRRPGLHRSQPAALKDVVGVS